MNIQDKIINGELAFSVQDVDNIYEYVMVMQSLTAELAFQMDIETPTVTEHEDETGTYLIIHTADHIQSLNFIDLYIDLLNDPELELDIDHLQLYTFNSFVYQRFNNSKHEKIEHIASNLFEDVMTMDKQIIEMDHSINYNGVLSLRKTLSILANGLESLGIDVIDRINQNSQPTLH